MFRNQALLPTLLIAMSLMSACGHRRAAEPGAAAPIQAERASKATQPAKAVGKPETTAKGEVVQKVEDDGKTGEVRGTPAPDSQFIQLRMGMSKKDVTKLLGAPSDKHSYITGKGFLLSVGSDTYREELIYKGLGRLTFASNGGISTGAHLIRIIHNAEEPGTRS